MKKITLVVACLLSAYVAQAENLIVNGDFETELTKETSDTGTEADLSKDGRFRNIWSAVADVTRDNAPSAGSVPVTSGKWYMCANSNAHKVQIAVEDDNKVLSMGINANWGNPLHKAMYLLPEIDSTKKVTLKFRYKTLTPDNTSKILVSITDGSHRVRHADADYSSGKDEDKKAYGFENEQFQSGLWSSRVFNNKVKTATQKQVVPTSEWQNFEFEMNLPVYYTNLRGYNSSIEPHKSTFIVLEIDRKDRASAIETLIDDVSLVYEGTTPTSIGTATTFDWNVSGAAGQMRLSNLTAGSQVVVRQLTGQTVVAKTATGSQIQISLAAGMYLVTVDGQTAKAIVK